MEDHQIIELYFARDELAIEETAKRYGGVCMQVSMDILRDRMDAEECVSDTWLQTWRSIPPQRHLAPDLAEHPAPAADHTEGISVPHHPQSVHQPSA